MSAPRLLSSRRIRTTPFTPRIESLGVSGYSVVNHTILPKGFRHSVEEDYWHLREYVQLWDVGCQRQVELKGADAAKLTQLMTPRNLSKAQVGQCLYAPCIDETAGMLNDPVILKLAEDHYWLSIADSDLLLWAKGLALGYKLSVDICEPDVWPVAIQGPKSDDLMASVFGDAVRSIGFFRFAWLPLDGHNYLVARSGYSKQGGFEIYLDDSQLALSLWDRLWQAGEPFSVRPGSPNLIERIESGLFSYGNEMTRTDNPLQCRLGQYCDLQSDLDYAGRDALIALAAKPLDRQLCGVIFGTAPCPPCASTWIVSQDGKQMGYVTSAIWSPRLQANVALAMINQQYVTHNQAVTVTDSDDTIHDGLVSDLPMK